AAALRRILVDSNRVLPLPQPGNRYLHMDYGQLFAFRERIGECVCEMRETERSALRERVMQEAATIGMTLEELVQLGSNRGGRPPRPGGGLSYGEDVSGLLDH